MLTIHRHINVHPTHVNGIRVIYPKFSIKILSFQFTLSIPAIPWTSLSPLTGSQSFPLSPALATCSLLLLVTIKRPPTQVRWTWFGQTRNNITSISWTLFLTRSNVFAFRYELDQFVYEIITQEPPQLPSARLKSLTFFLLWRLPFYSLLKEKECK